MSISLKVYADAALANVLSKLAVNQKQDGSTGPVDTVVYLGSTATSKKFQAASNPGTDQITLSVADSDPSNGHETTEVKLALTQAGLDTATAGASLDLGTQILSESANALPVWVRVQDATGVVGISTELSLTTNEIEETNV